MPLAAQHGAMACMPPDTATTMRDSPHATSISPSGIGKVYLYDHGSTVPLANEIQVYIADGFVEYIPFNGAVRAASCLLASREISDLLIMGRCVLSTQRGSAGR